MKKLIIVRHGEYDVDDGSLTDAGYDAIYSLSEKIRPLVDGRSVKILSSIAIRARQTAAILKSKLDADIEYHEVLWSEPSRPEDLPRTLKLVEKNKDFEILILVTHFEYTCKFPVFFARKRWGIPAYTSGLDKGCAWILDCERKAVDHLSRQ